MILNLVFGFVAILAVVLAALYFAKARSSQESLHNLTQQRDALLQEREQLQQRATEVQVNQHKDTLKIQQLTDALTAQKERYEAELKGTEVRLTQQRENHEREIAEQQRQRTEQQRNFEAMRAQMGTEFKLLATNILEEKGKQFTEVNQKSIDQLLTPLQHRLTEFKAKVEETYGNESRERFSLNQRICELVELNQRISQEANNLTKALKGDSKVQGDWGEMILESILEKSGLVKGREYFTQETLQGEDGKSILTEEGRKLRPDVVVVYPDQRRVVIDSKVSLTAYVRYTEAESSEEAAKAMTEHIRSLKAHVDELAVKQYQDYVDSLDFVMMFIPNEPAYLVAMQHDSNLWQYAYAKRVMLISPTNLIAALKLIVDLWKREKQSRNAAQIAERGGALYDKFVNLLESLNEVGTHLERTTNSYQQALKQLKEGRGNLLGQVEKLRTLGVKAKKELPPSFQGEDMEGEEA